jgi:hypothetical protein
MAHFAELNADNTVLRVIVVGNDMTLDPNGQESEAVGIAFCHSLFGADTNWVQTSYNGNIRKNYAGIGYIYDLARDAFIPPKPGGDNWVLDENTCQWYDPVLAAANTDIGVSRV